MGVTDSDKVCTEQSGHSDEQLNNQRACTIVAATFGVDLQPLFAMFRCANCNVVDADTVRQSFKAFGDLSALVDDAKKKPGGDAPQIVPVVDPENVETLAKAKVVEGCGFLLFQSRPEAALLDAMAEGCSTSEALERWERSARSLLQIYYRNRRTATVLSYEVLRRYPQKSVGHLRQCLGIDIDVEGSTTVINAINDGKVSEARRLVAMQIVSQSANVRDVMDELDACLPVDLSVDDAITSIDLELACEELVQNGLHGTVRSDLAEENELLLLQLRQVQEEVDRYYLELQDSVKRRSSLEKRLNECKETLGTREGELEDAKRRIEDFTRSTSWRITLPIRVLGRFASRKRK